MTTDFLVLKALVNILDNVKQPNNTPVFNLVDEFTGQYTDDEGNPLWTSPAALIELVEIDWEVQSSELPQMGKLYFNIHFIDETGYDDKDRRLQTTHPDNVAQGVNKLRLKVVKLSDLGVNLSDLLLGRIQRTKTRYVSDLSNVVVTIVSFECNVTDYSGLTAWTEVIVPILTKVYFVDDELEFKQQIENG